MTHDSHNAPAPWPVPQVIDGETVEAVMFEVVGVDDEGNRTVRVWVCWGDTLRSADVVFDRETWERADA